MINAEGAFQYQHVLAATAPARRSKGSAVSFDGPRDLLSAV
jgi:hypothetical protein